MSSTERLDPVDEAYGRQTEIYIRFYLLKYHGPFRFTNKDESIKIFQHLKQLFEAGIRRKSDRMNFYTFEKYFGTAKKNVEMKKKNVHA